MDSMDDFPGVAASRAVEYMMEGIVLGFRSCEESGEPLSITQQAMILSNISTATSALEGGIRADVEKILSEVVNDAIRRSEGNDA